MVLNTDTTYGREDLVDWPAGHQYLAVLGHPVKHSLSPVMHNAAISEMARQHLALQDWLYVKFDIRAGELSEVLPEFHQAGFRGLNLTLPHKVEALSLVDYLDPDAQHFGAVNTLVRTNTGYAGHNTDGFGLQYAVRKDFGIQLTDRPIILLGAGGAARTIAIHALKQRVELWIGNRGAGRLEELKSSISAAGFRANYFALDDIPDGLPAIPLLINATPLGLNETDPSPIALDRFDGETFIYDTTYGSSTNGLKQQAEKYGMKYTDGLSMLAGQGAKSLEIWTGLKVPMDTMFQAAEKALLKGDVT